MLSAYIKRLHRDMCTYIYTDMYIFMYAYIYYCITVCLYIAEKCNTEKSTLASQFTHSHCWASFWPKRFVFALTVAGANVCTHTHTHKPTICMYVFVYLESCWNFYLYSRVHFATASYIHMYMCMYVCICLCVFVCVHLILYNICNSVEALCESSLLTFSRILSEVN